MDLLDPVMFHDAWGSRTSIAELQGRPAPTAEPESELWFGAHEEGPARLVRGGAVHDLGQVIAADPAGELGAEVLAAYGPRLPFLLKVLAPGHAISIQSHPSGDQARLQRAAAASGHRDEVYVDDWPKPELLLAVTPFEVFAGMRPAAELEELVRLLDVPALTAMATGAGEDLGRALLERVLRVPPEERADFVAQVRDACSRRDVARSRYAAECGSVARVAEDHPGDIGLVVLLLMRHRILAPGECIDVPAGVLHSYVDGLGIEVLANSDNVVRAGLTSKPVDVEELLRIVDPGATGIAATPLLGADGLEHYPTSAAHFAVARARRPEAAPVPGQGRPRLVFCLRGEVEVRCGTDRLTLGPTTAAYLPANDPAAEISGPGECYCVTVGG